MLEEDKGRLSQFLLTGYPFRSYFDIKVTDIGDYMDYSLDEYTFRFTRWKSKARGRLFQQSVEILPLLYNKIIKKIMCCPKINMTRVKWIARFFYL